MNLYLSGILWVLGVAAAAAFVAFLVHRYTSGEGRSSNDAVGQVFTIVGGLNAVLMAFVLISLFDSVSTVRDGAYNEANSVVAIYWAGDALPEPARGEIKDLSRSYVRAVIDQEWPSMRDGQSIGGPGWALLDRLRTSIDRAPAESSWQEGRKSEAAGQLWNVYQARQTRLTSAGSDGVSTVVWLALLVGGVLTVALPYLLDGPNLLTRIIIISALAGTLALLMFAIYQLQNPFSGGARVEPDAFTSILDRFSADRAG
jgi:hypothetical protein